MGLADRFLGVKSLLDLPWQFTAAGQTRSLKLLIPTFQTLVRTCTPASRRCTFLVTNKTLGFWKDKSQVLVNPTQILCYPF